MNLKELKGAFIGMVLGDGCLVKQAKHAYLTYVHSIKQKDYALSKTKYLKELTKVNVTYPTTYLNGKPFKKIVVRGLCHPKYTRLYERFYYQGKKTIDEHLLKSLTPLGLAIWYQDDGHYGNYGDRNYIILCTHNFNYAEHELMQKWLKYKFELNWSIKHDKNGYHLRLNRNQIGDFMDTIKPYMVLKYKIADCGNDKPHPTTWVTRGDGGRFVRKSPVRGEDIV
jgi:hypothetical protein